MQAARTTVPTSSEIEAIVRRVLQRLQGQPGPPMQHAGPPAGELGPGAIASASTPGSAVVRLDQPLVTLEDLRQRWSEMQSLEVPQRCVVTPAVRDELRRRGLQLQRFESHSTASALSAPAPAATRLLVLIPATGKSEVRSQLKSDEAQVATMAPDCQSSPATVRSHVAKEHNVCIWAASRPFAAVRACAAQESIVAVQLSRAEELSQALEQAQPNVLILDDYRWTASAIVHLARAWIQGGQTRTGNR